MNAPADIAEYEKQRAARNMPSTYKRTCPACDGSGIAGQDVDGIWRGGGSCRRCSGTGFIEFTVVDNKKE